MSFWLSIPFFWPREQLGIGSILSFEVNFERNRGLELETKLLIHFAHILIVSDSSSMPSWAFHSSFVESAYQSVWALCLLSIAWFVLSPGSLDLTLTKQNPWYRSYCVEWYWSNLRMGRGLRRLTWLSLNIIMILMQMTFHLAWVDLDVDPLLVGNVGVDPNLCHTVRVYWLPYNYIWVWLHPITDAQKLFHCWYIALSETRTCYVFNGLYLLNFMNFVVSYLQLLMRVFLFS